MHNTLLGDITWALGGDASDEAKTKLILERINRYGQYVGTCIDPITKEICVDAASVVENAGLLQQKVLDHGYVNLMDVMPRLLPLNLKTADFALADAARGSYQKGTKRLRDDAGLVDYLVRHLHTSPIEMGELKFAMRMPIFVARQFVRHRTAALNEESARYSVLSSDFYIPDPSQWRVNTAANRQATVVGDFAESDAQALAQVLRDHCSTAYDLYEAYLRDPDKDGEDAPEVEDSPWEVLAGIAGVSREQARMVLPLNIYTRWVWKCDLKNLLHLLKLRCDSHAQYEIRVYADAIARVVELLFPATWKSWKDNFMEGLNFSGTEQTLLAGLLSSTDYGIRQAYEELGWSKRRVAEFEVKAKKIGLTFD